MTLLEEIEAYIEKMKSAASATRRDFAVGVELHQRYVDLLDEVRDQLETDGESFREYCRKLDLVTSKVSPSQIDCFTRKG